MSRIKETYTRLRQQGRVWLRLLAARRAALRAGFRAFRKRQAERHIPIALKLALLFSLLIAGGMIVLGILIGTNQSRMLQEQMVSFGRTVVLQVAESAKEPLLAEDTLGLELIVNNLNNQHEILGAAIYAFEGERVASAGAVPPPGLLADSGIGKPRLRHDTLEWLQHSSKRPALPLLSFLAPIRLKDAGGQGDELTVGYALLSFNRERLNEAQEDTFAAVTATIVLMLILTTFLSLRLGSRITRPISDLMEASHAIARGEYHLRVTDRRNDELGVLMQSLKVMGEGLLRKEQVEEVFSRYVSPQVAQQAIKDLNHMEKVELGGQHMEASVLFADIVGFTSMSENLSPQEVSGLLNEYFTQIAYAVHFCGGHIDKYMGDCAMIVFGVPEHYPDHAFRALACSWMILRLVERMNERRVRLGKHPVEFRIGANAGDVLAGNMGSADRMEYTVVGDTVNIASRLSHAGGPGEVIFSEMMGNFSGVEGRIRSEHHDNMQVRGKKEPVATYRVLDIDDVFRREVIARIDEIMRNLEPEE